MYFKITLGSVLRVFVNIVRPSMIVLEFASLLAHIAFIFGDSMLSTRRAFSDNYHGDTHSQLDSEAASPPRNVLLDGYLANDKWGTKQETEKLTCNDDVGRLSQDPQCRSQTSCLQYPSLQCRSLPNELTPLVHCSSSRMVPLSLTPHHLAR